MLDLGPISFYTDIIFTHIRIILFKYTLISMNMARGTVHNLSTFLSISKRFSGFPIIPISSLSLLYKSNDHRRTGRVFVRGGGGGGGWAEVSCPNIFSIACPKIKLPEYNLFFLPHGHLKNAKGGGGGEAAAPLAPCPVYAAMPMIHLSIFIRVLGGKLSQLHL